MKMMKTFLLAAIFALFSGAAFGADEIPKFDAADVNGDGAIDEAEYAPAKEAGAEGTFAELDADGNGKLDKEEYAVALGEECE